MKADQEKKLAKENEKLKADNKKALNRFVSDEALKEEEKYRQYLKFINDNIAKNSQLKQASLESRKSITLALNTLTNDRMKIIDIVCRNFVITIKIVFVIYIYILTWSSYLIRLAS
jgi:hypothetical protein